MTERDKESSGSCLCGAVAFTVSNSCHDAYFCHCAQCRKITGTAYAANLITSPGALRWTAGADHVTRFDHPTRGFSKAFCEVCGSGLPYLNSSQTALIVPAGALEGEPRVAKGARIFWGDRSSWGDHVADYPAFEAFPE